MQELHHFYMFAGNITFMDSEGNAAISNASVVVPTTDQRVTAHDMARASQGLQMNLFQRINQQVKVIDLNIMSVSYLGHMTEDEFNAGVDVPSVDPEEAANDVTVQ